MISDIRTEFDAFQTSLYNSPGGYRAAHARWSSLYELACQTSFIPLETNVNSPFGRRGYMALACYALETKDTSLFAKVCEAGMGWEKQWFEDSN